jgi:predicted MFS family arabinose efflux permease
LSARDPRSFEASPAYTRGVLALLFLTAVFSLADRYIFGMLIEPLKREFGVSDTWLGLASGPFFALFFFAAGLPIAHWADRGVRRSILALGLFAWSALTLVSGLAASFAQLLVARLAIGVGEAAGTPTAHALISDYYPPQRRAGALAIYTAGASTGVFVAYLVGGWIQELWGWRGVFFCLGAPGMALAVAVRLLVREPPRGRFDAASARPMPTRMALRDLLGLASYRNLLAAMSLHSLAFTGSSTWNAPFLARVHGMQPGEIGTALAFGSASFMLAGILAAGWATNRLVVRDARWTLWTPGLATIAVAPFTLAFLFAPSRDVALACLAPAAFFTGFGTPGMHAATQALARPASRATAAALNLMALTLIGTGVGPALVGVLNDALAGSFGAGAIRVSLALVAATAVWSGLHALRAARSFRADAGR